MEVKKLYELLLLEDNPDDVFIIKRIYDKSGAIFNITTVSTKATFEQKFNDPDYSPHAIISDYYLNGYGGELALNLVRSKDSIIPFIFVTGALGDEKAASLMMMGANDFLLKEHLSQLPGITLRLIEELKSKKEKLQYQQELEQTNNILNILLKSMQDFIFMKDEQMRYITINDAMSEHFNVSRDEFLGKTDTQLFAQDISLKSEESDSYVIQKRQSILYETSYIDTKGNKVVLETLKTPLIDHDEKVTGIIGVSRDISLKKIQDDRIRKSEELLNESEKQTQYGSFQYDPKTKKISGSRQFYKMISIAEESSAEMDLGGLISLVYLPERRIFIHGIEEAIKNKKEFSMEHRLVPSNKSKVMQCRTTLNPVMNSQGFTFYGSIKDIGKDRENKNAIIDAQENERNMLAAELHDGLTQKLVAAKMYLSSMDQDNMSFSRIKTASELIKSGLSETTRLTRSLSLHNFENLGFKNSLLEVIESFPTEITINYEFTFEEKKLDANISIALYRVIQEALTNIMKYAEASTVGIFIEEKNEILRCRIIDDGKGFNLNEEQARGNGLKNMQQRIHRCNGIIQITTSNGEGTKIDISLPFN